MKRRKTTMRFSDEDEALIAAIKARYGLVSTTAAIRLALRNEVRSQVRSEPPESAPERTKPPQNAAE